MNISVVIPAYNAEKTISATLQSVLNQTCPPSEVIVVNDGSKDSTKERVLEFGDQVKLINQENSGVSAARNFGIEHSNSDWIAFLDSDDLWLPRKLELQVSLLEKHEHVHWCATRYFECVGKNKTLSSFGEPVAEDEEVAGKIIHSLQAISDNSNIWVSTILIKKSLVQSAGGFHTNLSSTADNDLWFRVGKIESDIAFVNQPLAHYMVNPVGMSRMETKQISPARYEFFERLAGHIEDSGSENRKLFEKIFDRYTGQYMFNLARTGNHEASRSLLTWLREKSYRMPGWNYRWIHLIPTSWVDCMRSAKHILRRKRN